MAVSFHGLPAVTPSLGTRPPAARAAATAAGSPISRAAAWALAARARTVPIRSSPRAKARRPSMASRGRVSLWACASNSDSVRSAQSAAHTASTRRSASLRVKAPGWRSIPNDSPISGPGCVVTSPIPMPATNASLVKAARSRHRHTYSGHGPRGSQGREARNRLKRSTRGALGVASLDATPLAVGSRAGLPGQPVWVPLQPPASSWKCATVARQCHEALLLLEPSEERVKWTSGRRAMVAAVASHGSGGPPSDYLAQEVVLARVPTRRDVAEHVKHQPDRRLMVRRVLTSTERSHAVRDVDAV